MKNLLSFSSRMLVAIVFLTFISCNKNTDLGVPDGKEQNEELVNVSFNFADFTSLKTPLSPNYSGKQLTSSSISALSVIDKYLYYWSFNNKDFRPEIRFNTELTPSFTYADEDIMSVFVPSNYYYEDFAAGSAVYLLGHKEILVKMPIANVRKIESFGFDIGSSENGPKAIDIYYSTNKGIKYEIISSDNQFKTATEFQQNSFSFDLSGKNIQADELWVKIVPKAGNRTNSKEYNESGVSYFDNFHLIGVRPGYPIPNPKDKLHYFLFNKDKSKNVISGVKYLDSNSSLNLSIPVGEYDICFVTNDSDTDLLFPSNISIDNFYVSNKFSNYQANIFGYNGKLKVDKDLSSRIVLERLFSQVIVEFSDVKGLENITKITLTPEHKPFFYAPYNANLTNPIVDNSTIEILNTFTNNKQVVFNQFLGEPKTSTPVSYKLSAYGKSGVLRTVTLSSDLESNLQLIFKGNLLNITDFDNIFSITKNLNWKGQKEAGF